MIYIGQQSIRAALFDLDDLLVDSTPSRMVFIFTALKKLGVPYDRGRDRTVVLSKGDAPGTLGIWNFPGTVLTLSDDALKALAYPAELIASRDPQGFMNFGCDVLRQAMNEASDEGTVIIDGALELLTFCKSNNVPTGIISNAAERNIRPLLQRLGLNAWVDIVFGDNPERRNTGGQVITKSSDAAAAFAIVFEQLHALRPDLADIQPGEIIYAGDRPSDIAFAHKVGCIAVHVPSVILPTVGSWPENIPAPNITAPNLHVLRRNFATTSTSLSGGIKTLTNPTVP